jgi:hypothetical protein
MQIALHEKISAHGRESADDIYAGDLINSLKDVIPMKKEHAVRVEQFVQAWSDIGSTAAGSTVLKKFAILGPESSGKSTLLETLFCEGKRSLPRGDTDCTVWPIRVTFNHSDKEIRRVGWSGEQLEAISPDEVTEHIETMVSRRKEKAAEEGLSTWALVEKDLQDGGLEIILHIEGPGYLPAIVVDLPGARSNPHDTRVISWSTRSTRRRLIMSYSQPIIQQTISNT